MMEIYTVEAIKKRLIDVHDPSQLMSNPWNEGYLSALADQGITSEDEHDELMAWLKE